FDIFILLFNNLKTPVMQRFTSKCFKNSGVLRNRSKKKKRVKPFLLILFLSEEKVSKKTLGQ
ncbi:MAG: hypothetical protein IKN49_07025, partial [Elusimicrobiaceae bacterium]|nr:hypothetical protein [Elusimicrobiaceae bacterium]